MINKEIEQEHIEWQEKWNKELVKRGRQPEEFKFVAVGYLDTLEPPFEKVFFQVHGLRPKRIIRTPEYNSHDRDAQCLSSGALARRGGRVLTSARYSPTAE